MNPRTPPAVHQPIACQHCHGKSGHPPIPGEGVNVCLPCVWRLGRKVKEAAERQDILDDQAVKRRLAALGISYPDDEVAA